MDKRADLALFMAIIALGAWYYSLTGQLRVPAIWLVSGDFLGPGGIPKGLAIILMAGASWLAFLRLRTWRRSPGWLVEPDGDADEPEYPASLLRVVLVVAFSFAFLYALSRVGYLVASPVYLGLLLWLYGVRDWRFLVAVALGTTVVLFVGFRLLNVDFPLGFMEGMF